MAKLPRAFQRFLDDFPAVAAAYQGLGEAASTSGPLDARTQKLVKLGMAIAAGQEGGTHAQARAALKAGATPAELCQVALLGITTLGFPQANTGLCWIRDVTEPESPK